MFNDVNESTVFATWFRMLSIALIDSAHGETGIKWKFLAAPGYQLNPVKKLSGKRFCNIDQIPTHLTSDEKIFIFNKSKNLNQDSIVVEVGSYLGSSACFNR